MGFNRHNLELLLAENSFQKINGSYLSLGKQTVTQPVEICRNLFEKYGQDMHPIDALHSARNYDQVTRDANNTISDHDMIESITDATYLPLPGHI